MSNSVVYSQITVIQCGVISMLVVLFINDMLNNTYHLQNCSFTYEYITLFRLLHADDTVLFSKS